MKLKRKLIAALAASVMLTACGAEEKVETSETQTAPVQTTATAIQTTKAAVKTIKRTGLASFMRIINGTIIFQARR